MKLDVLKLDVSEIRRVHPNYPLGRRRGNPQRLFARYDPTKQDRSRRVARYCRSAMSAFTESFGDEPTQLMSSTQLMAPPVPGSIVVHPSF